MTIHAKRILSASLAAAGLTLAACGSSNDVAYYPAAWGSPGYCYYLQSPYECYGHHYGVPVVMPLYWHQRYAGYYDSPAYISTYVPARYRSTATAQGRAFEQRYASQIKSGARWASYRGSNGTTVPGTKIGRSAVYKAGSARSTGFSTGSARSSPCASLRTYFVAKGGGSSSSGGGGGGRSSSGGSARSGSVGSSSSSKGSGGKSGGRNC